MNIVITCKHMQSSKQLEELIEDKLTKLSKYDQGQMRIDWKCVKEGDNYSSEVLVVADHISINASAQEDSLYKTIDKVISKLDKQLTKLKEKAAR